MSVSAEEIGAAEKDPSSPLSAGDEMPSAPGENGSSGERESDRA